jgi:hypothetical protein
MVFFTVLGDLPWMPSTCVARSLHAMSCSPAAWACHSTWSTASRQLPTMSHVIGYLEFTGGGEGVVEVAFVTGNARLNANPLPGACRRPLAVISVSLAAISPPTAFLRLLHALQAVHDHGNLRPCLGASVMAGFAAIVMEPEHGAGWAHHPLEEGEQCTNSAVVGVVGVGE